MQARGRRRVQRWRAILVLALVVLALGLAIRGETEKASAVPIGGVEFPLGEASFADLVISSVVGPGVQSPHDDAARLLGTPDGDHFSLGNANGIQLHIPSAAFLSCRGFIVQTVILAPTGLELTNALSFTIP